MDNEPKIGGQIRAAREALGMTQAELGAHLGIAPETIGRYEIDERRPRADRLRRISERLAAPGLLQAGVNPDETVGERIRRMREGLGLSQGDLAARLDVTLAAVSQYERGIRVPGGKDLETNAAMLVRLARALHTTTDEMLGGQRLASTSQAKEISQRGRSVGDRLRLLRESANMLQKDLGAQVGVGNAAISHYEANLRVPGGKSLETNAAMLVRLARALRATTDEILGGSPC